MSPKRDMRRGEPLTPAQAETLAAIVKLTAAKRVPPTHEDIAIELGKAEPTVGASVAILVRKRFVVRNGARRGIAVTRRGHAAAKAVASE